MATETFSPAYRLFPLHDLKDLSHNRCRPPFLSHRSQLLHLIEALHQDCIIINEILCSESELNAQTITLDRCRLEWLMIERCSHIFCDSQSFLAQNDTKPVELQFEPFTAISKPLSMIEWSVSSLLLFENSKP